MAISNLNIGDYIQKQNGDEISANEWNTIFQDIQTAVNNVITAVNFGSGGSEGGNSGGNGGPSTALYVNGVLHTESPVILEPQETYTLQGELYGQLIINAAQYQGNADKTFKNTNLIFDGVTIITSANCGVYYTIPSGDVKGYKGITITLAGDSVNTVMCTTVVAAGPDQRGAIYSENNLRIQGSGYLNCINKGGHAMRASEIKLYNPHIYCDGAHDGIHAKNISIYDGVYYFTNVNDCFGTSDSAKASIFVCGGKIIANNMKTPAGNIFDYKYGHAYYIKTPEIITNIPKSRYATPYDPNTASGLNTRDGGLQDIKVTEYYGSASVRIYASKTAMEEDIANGLVSGVAVSLTDGVYKINHKNQGKAIFVSGLIQHPIEIVKDEYYNTVNGANDYAANIYLYDACILATGNKAAISFGTKASRLKLESYKGTINFIMQNEVTNGGSSYDYDAVKSENNISLELGGDSTLYISSHLGDGLDGSDVTCTDSTGVIYIEGCGQRGIKGTSIVIGPAAEISGGVPTFYVETNEEAENLSNASVDATLATTFDGCFIVRNNCQIDHPSDVGNTTGDASKLVGFADIYARKGKRDTSGNKGSLFTLRKYLTGVLITDSVGAFVKMDFDFSPNIFVSTIISQGIYNLERLTQEQYLVYPKYSAPIIDKNKFITQVAAGS